MEDNIKEEALRLQEKYGYLSIDVAKEIREYDQNDRYFWDCVINEINEIKYK